MKFLNMTKMRFFFSFLCLTSLLFTCSLGVQAQKQRLSFGPRIGTNISRINGGYGSQYISGFSGGLFLMYSNISHFGVSADVLYSQRGGKYDYMATPVGSHYTYTQRLNYIDVPILARYFLNLKGKFRPNIFAGGSANFLLSAKQKNLTQNDQKLPDVDKKDDYQNIDLGLVVGLGLNFEVMKGRRLLLDIRYQPGLVAIQKASDSNDVHNSTLSFLLSYGFGVGKKYK